MSYIQPTGGDSYGALSGEARDRISQDIHNKVNEADGVRAKDGIDSNGKSRTAGPWKYILGLIVFIALLLLLFVLISHSGN